MIDRMLEKDMLPRGSAIGFISSAAGLGWEANLELLKELLATPDVETGAKWFHDNGKAAYFHPTQPVFAYVSAQAHTMLKRAILPNAICPGTPPNPPPTPHPQLWPPAVPPPPPPTHTT